ncbi:hypothetical protein QL285_034127 [Trifolium repens]|nr:hypothetical protein QL285_034127 [Trifolium repens]
MVSFWSLNYLLFHFGPLTLLRLPNKSLSVKFNQILLIFITFIIKSRISSTHSSPTHKFIAPFTTKLTKMKKHNKFNNSSPNPIPLIHSLSSISLLYGCVWM